MGRTFDLGNILGIRIRVHWLFLVLLGYVLLFGGGLGAVVLVCAVFVFVVLHELGHSLVARAYGIHVRDITLLPIGGVARLDGMAPTPKAEFWIALAGPMVNIVLALLLLPLALAVSAGGLALGWNVFGSFAEFLGLLFTVNISLALFNLLPAFPMDGGRIVRAFLARKHGMLEATRKAARLGRWMALFMAIAGFATMRPMLLLIALFIYLAGTQELMAVKLRYAQAPTVEFHSQGIWRQGPEAGPTPSRDPFGMDPRHIEEMLRRLKDDMRRRR